MEKLINLLIKEEKNERTIFDQIGNFTKNIFSRKNFRIKIKVISLENITKKNI